jgi:pimeloyl-ACP methyl ester carboxylesterase
VADYVLVHGAWVGGWSYDRLARELSERGHRVVVAQLAGLGTRQSELEPGITLSTHITDTIGQIEAAGFDRFVLCGHSYGGMVITGVAARLGARIDALCYIDAFLPGDGQSLWDITGDYEHRWYIDSQKFTPGLVAPIGSEELLGLPGFGRHPLLTLTEAVRFTGEETKVPRHVYIFASEWQPSPFPRFRDAVKSDPAWELHELGGGHMVMADQPEALLEVVLGLAFPRVPH